MISDSPERNKDSSDYERLIGIAFSEIVRKLKPGRYMTMTFHNTSIEVWSVIIRAATIAGFDLEKIIYQPPAVKPSKASLHPYGSSFGDYYLRFRKPVQPKMIYGDSEHLRQKYENIVVSTAKSIIAHRGHPVRYQHILNAIIPELDKNGVLLYANINIEDVMKNHLGKEFLFVDALDEQGNVVGKKWWLAHPEEYKIPLIPLEDRVEKALVNLLRRKDRVTFDEVEQEIFKNFPNALTPEAYTIKEVLEEYAKKLPGGYWALKPAVKIDYDKHQEYVNALVRIGHALGYEVWAPDRHPDIRNLLLKELKLEVSSAHLDRIKKIDVLWIRNGRIEFSFEVENTTSMSEAIIRASNIPYANRRLAVLPDDRSDFLRRRLREPMLAERIRQDKWQVVFYSAVDRLFRKLQTAKHIEIADLEQSISKPALSGNTQIPLFEADGH